ncbi:hypothetical protein [Desulfosporosinus sp. FKB]|uniref:hypothetical protein n=1 Tax=Desulfosporosinus sp. FKB TaxID=1969835 RepID=UPI000B498D14|nr:hypothetical protein [Desulfosporosinus sp. FKB]
MGTKFANIQVLDLPICDVENLLPGCIAKKLSANWTTILHEEFQIGMIEQVGKVLSKKIEKTILTVGYFDDDVIALHIFRNGKCVTCHISEYAYGYKKKIGNPSKFVSELELPDSDTERLKGIFKCEDLAKKVELLERLLAAPLWIDKEALIEYGDENFKRERDTVFIDEYIWEQKELNKKIKSQTKVRLLIEFEGLLASSSQSGKFLVHLPSADGKYYSHLQHIYNTTPEGFLSTLYKEDIIKFNLFDEILSNNSYIVVYNNSSISYSTNERGIEETKRMPAKMSFLDYNGNLITETIFPIEVSKPLLLFSDGTVLCLRTLRKGLNQGLVAYRPDGNKRWELEVGYLHIYPQLYNNNVFLHYKKDDKSEILK